MSSISWQLRCPADRRVATTKDRRNLGHVGNKAADRDKTPPPSCWWGSHCQARRAA